MVQYWFDLGLEALSNILGYKPYDHLVNECLARELAFSVDFADDRSTQLQQAETCTRAMIKKSGLQSCLMSIEVVSV
jgi:hypothetical protein